MITLSLLETASFLGCSDFFLDKNYNGIGIDTRTLEPGQLFIAILGDQFDGHDFVYDAERKGAIAALVSKKIESVSIPQLVVPDTIAALGKLAHYWRSRFMLPLIAVTGSNGKTTLKNMIGSILRAAVAGHAEQCLVTEGNYNNHIGLPLSLCRLSSAHRYGVLEMGMNHFGEIAYLSKMTEPQVAVINNAATAHLEGVGDLAGVARAKGEIFLGLQKNGTAILNNDDSQIHYWKTLVGSTKTLTFGLDHPSDIAATLVDARSIELVTPKGCITLTLPLLGRHNILNALAATAATLAIGIDLETIKKGLETVAAEKGRMQPYTLASGACLINDTYNANPFSLQAAVNTLATFPGARVLVLADMKELGDETAQLHHESGEYIRSKGIQHLLTLGELSQHAARGFGETAQHFTDIEKLIAALQPFLVKDTTILIKGSRSMRMERVVEKLHDH